MQHLAHAAMGLVIVCSPELVESLLAVPLQAQAMHRVTPAGSAPPPTSATPPLHPPCFHTLQVKPDRHVVLQMERDQ